MSNKNKKFEEDYEYRIYKIKHYGKKHNWSIAMESDNIIMFTNAEKIILTINAKNLTIETDLNHPAKGETKLLRKGDFNMKMIEKIFRNPRVHTPNNIKTNYIN